MWIGAFVGPQHCCMLNLFIYFSFLFIYFSLFIYLFQFILKRAAGQSEGEAVMLM